MGCDIHMYIEYKSKENLTYTNFGGRINPGRNYLLFGMLSKGVRSENPLGVEPKGLPDRITLSYHTNNDSIVRIDDKIAENDDTGEWCTLETAERWAKYGSIIYYNKDNFPEYITHPDWHSHSWLTVEEYREQLIRYSQHPEVLKFGWKEPEYEAVLAAMDSFNKNGYDCRIVFWFDN